MENWKTIEGYEDYAISDLGNVKSIRFDRLLKPSVNGSGYQYVNLVRSKVIKTHSVHKMVMEHFGETKTQQNFIIDHVDGVKTNNKIENLQWMTIQHNTTKFYGNADKKKQVVEMFNAGLKVKEIVKLTQLSDYTVRQTINNFQCTLQHCAVAT